MQQVIHDCFILHDETKKFHVKPWTNNLMIFEPKIRVN